MAGGLSLVYARKVAEIATRHGETADRVIPPDPDWPLPARDAPSPFADLWFVQCVVDDWPTNITFLWGPWDRTLADLMIADLGVDGKLWDGGDSVRVLSAILVRADEVL